jgi:hypothetical protein
MVITALLPLQALSLIAGGRAVHPISGRREYGGLQMDQVKRMKELEQESQRLRKAVSDLTLDKLIPCRGRQGKLLSPSPTPVH